MELRDYQQEDCNSTIEALTNGRNPLLVGFTSYGKTILFSALAWRWYQETGQRVLILAHLRELITQTANKFKRYTGHRAIIEMGEEKATPWMCYDEPVVVASTQTMQGERLIKWPKDFFGLIIVDEAHRGVGETYFDIYHHFDGARRLGVTATPDRLDKRPILSLDGRAPFDHLVANRDFHWGIENGWIVEPMTRMVYVKEINLTRIKTKKGADFTEGQVQSVMEQDEVILKCVQPTFLEHYGKPTLFFCGKVSTAKRFADVLNQKFRPGSCEYICSYRYDDDGRKLPADPEMRQNEIAAFKRGDRWSLASVGVFKEGFDASVATVLAMCRFTNSRSFYAQGVGRVLRPWQIDDVPVIEGLATASERRAAIANSPKPHAIVFDFFGVSGKHELTHLVDLMAPAGTDESVIAHARRIIAKSGNAVKPKQALAQAQEEIAERENRWRELRESYESQIDYILEEVRHGKAGNLGMVSVDRRGEPPTEKQISFLRRLGVNEDAARSLTKTEANRQITHLKIKRAKGPPAFWQTKKLRDLGHAIPRTYEEAESIIQRLAT